MGQGLVADSIYLDAKEKLEEGENLTMIEKAIYDEYMEKSDDILVETARYVRDKRKCMNLREICKVIPKRYTKNEIASALSSLVRDKEITYNCNTKRWSSNLPIRGQIILRIRDEAKTKPHILNVVMSVKTNAVYMRGLEKDIRVSGINVQEAQDKFYKKLAKHYKDVGAAPLYIQDKIKQGWFSHVTFGGIDIEHTGINEVKFYEVGNLSQ